MKKADGKRKVTKRLARKPDQPQTITRSDINDSANQNEREAKQRQAASQRRNRVAVLYHSGKTQDEIADALDMAQSTVSEDLAFIRKQWIAQATDVIGDWVARELSFALGQRASALGQWQQSYDPRFADMVLKWTKRIADLLGLDAPDKVDDWTDRDWREYAQANGLDESDAIAEAEQIINAAKTGTLIPAPVSDTASDETPNANE